MIIPALGTKGVFKFAEPFNSLVKEAQEFTIAAIRTLKELEQSEEQPYDTIYVAVGLTETDFKEDLDGNVPIIVFVTDGGEHFYVPADRLLSEPISNGHKYREIAIIVNLGHIPTSMDMSATESLIKDTVYDSLSIIPNITVTPTSPVVSVDEEKHKTFMNLILNKRTVDKSYKTKYYELLTRFNKLTTLFGKVQEMYKKRSC